MKMRDIISTSLIYAGTTITFLEAVDLLISITVGLGTLAYTAAKLVEMYRRFQNRMMDEEQV